MDVSLTIIFIVIAAVNTLAGVISTVVPDSPHKIFIGGLPNYLNEDQVNYSQEGRYDKYIHWMDGSVAINSTLSSEQYYCAYSVSYLGQCV